MLMMFVVPKRVVQMCGCQKRGTLAFELDGGYQRGVSVLGRVRPFNK